MKTTTMLSNCEPWTYWNPFIPLVTSFPRSKWGYVKTKGLESLNSINQWMTRQVLYARPLPFCSDDQTTSVRSAHGFGFDVKYSNTNRWTHLVSHRPVVLPGRSAGVADIHWQSEITPRIPYKTAKHEGRSCFVLCHIVNDFYLLFLILAQLDLV